MRSLLALSLLAAACGDDSGDPMDAARADSSTDAGGPRDGGSDGGGMDAGSGLDAAADASTDGGFDAGAFPRLDLAVIGTGFGTREDVFVRGRYEDPVSGTPSSEMEDLVEGGAFELRWPDGYSTDWFGAFVVFYFDTDGDGACAAPDPAYSVFVYRMGDVAEARVTPSSSEITPADCP